MSTSIPPRFPITEDQIDWVVFRFYARVRAHPVLGPIFWKHVRNWDAHEAMAALTEGHANHVETAVARNLDLMEVQ